jgi:TolB-like protein/DNA-binding winged helix-turn-helix (wHTH) protein/tetratricopeptide (TPR) repeat protein
MAPEKSIPQNLVLDLTSFQLIRAGQPVKLEKTPMELLTLLVRRRGALVTREEIVQAIWGDAVHVDVDAGINTAIRKIRQALEDDAASPRCLETVVGKGYRFVGSIDVIDELAAPPTASSPIGRPGLRMKVALAAAGVAAVVLLGWWAIHHDVSAVSGAGNGRALIAVVPLENLGGDAGQEFFVRGLTEEVITQLGQLNPDRIGVVRYGSSTAARLAEAKGPNPRQQSGLRYLLEGSVRRQKEQTSMSVRLIRVADGKTVWTESYDRNAGEVLTLPSEIARHVGHELQIQVPAGDNRRPVAPEVVESYFRGRFEWERHVIPVRDEARAYFEHAIALDPSYAPAYAGLADFYRSRAMSDNVRAEESWRLAEQYAAQGLRLDSDSAESHIAIAQIKLMHDWDWPAAREHALRALQLNPSDPEAHSVYARYLRVAGNMEGAVSQRKQAAALDPFRLDLIFQLSLEYFFAHDYKNAVAAARQALAIDPDNSLAHGALCNNLWPLQQFEETVAECSKVLVLEGKADWIPGYVREYHERGYDAAKLFLDRKFLDEILKRPQPDLWDLANAYALVNKREEAMRTLFRALEIHDSGLLQIRVDPEFDSIRDHPRYPELIRRISFPSE